MSDTTALLQRYADATHAIERHAEAHKDIFDQHKRLVMSQIDADNALRDAIAESGQGASNGEFTVAIIPQEQDVCDFAKLDELVAGGVITNEVRQLIVKKQTRPPRITISRK